MSLPDDFLRKVGSATVELIGPATTCLLAVSGGPDSVAMAAAMSELAEDFPVDLGVAHLDHAIRPESAGDASWVAELAARLALPHFGERIDVPGLRAEEKLTLEEAARRARYSFLETTARHWGAGFVATGHTADDQAETVLFRVIRGTGLAGMAGIPRSRPISPQSAHVQLVRPLLDCTREEVLAFLEDRGLDFLNDESNFDVDIQSRARIRHELLPLLERYHNPDVRAALVRLAARAAEVNELVETAACAGIGEYVGPLPDDAREIAVPLEVLEGPQAVRVEVLRVVGSHLTGRMLLDRARLADDARELPEARVGKQFELGGVLAIRDYRHVALRLTGGDETPPVAWESGVTLPGETPLPAGLLRAERMLASELNMDEFSLTKTGFEEVFDANLLESGERLLCRTRRPGDRFHPLGASGERKLKDFFIDEKVPQSHRDGIPLLVLGDTIVWVIGHRLSEAARVGSESRDLFRLDFEPRKG